MNLTPKLSLNNPLLNSNNTLEKNQNFLFGSEVRKDKAKAITLPTPALKSDHVFGEKVEGPKSLLFKSLTKDVKVCSDLQPEDPPVILELKTSRVSSQDAQVGVSRPPSYTDLFSLF